MPIYVALLRGIAPTNPNMRNEKLREVFSELGFKEVRTVIATGNVIFQSKKTNKVKLEQSIEEALYANLGFHSTTIVRTKDEIETLLHHNPFKNVEHTHKTNVNITFTKPPNTLGLQYPYQAQDQTYSIIDEYEYAIASIVDLTTGKTPNVMAYLEKKLGKEITTRTWKTVGKIATAMGILNPQN